MSQVLSDEVEQLRKDIEGLKDALDTNHGHEKRAPTKPKDDSEPNRIAVKWNPAILEHDDLHLIFKEDNIPLLEDSNEVDYSKIKKKTFPGAPFLDLDVSKVPVENIIKQIAARVVTFRDEFERFYEWNFNKVLFHKMAWDYLAAE